VATPCPRCGGRLAEASYHDCTALDCRTCGGLFLDRSTIDRMSTEEGREIRLAFPRRPRAPEPTPVRYIHCPTCDKLMNRKIFAKVSGVIVDVCKDHGVWFDAGEVNAVIEFVEKGGLARAEKREREEHDREVASTRAAWQREHDAFTRAGGYGSSWNHRAYVDDEIFSSLFDVFNT
jgi:Zn-finger nucleic acid-binding protein